MVYQAMSVTLDELCQLNQALFTSLHHIVRTPYGENTGAVRNRFQVPPSIEERMDLSTFLGCKPTIDMAGGVMYGLDNLGAHHDSNIIIQLVAADVFPVFTSSQCTDVIAPVDHHVGAWMKEAMAVLHQHSRSSLLPVVIPPLGSCVSLLPIAPAHRTRLWHLPFAPAHEHRALCLKGVSTCLHLTGTRPADQCSVQENVSPGPLTPVSCCCEWILPRP
jgi:hypothetical protein